MVIRRILFILLLVIGTIPTIAQNGAITKDSILNSISVKLDDIYFSLRRFERYKLYPTENIYTHLKLDTMTGRIEQQQWSLDIKDEVTISINDQDLSHYPECGRFELYPTKNIYQFILLDKATGKSWHVQWGMEDNKRWIRRIY